VNDDHYKAGRYILEGKIPVECEDLLTWARWLEEHTADRVVKQETVGRFWVSTCFLGLDQNFFGDGPPLLFETMVFRDATPADRVEFAKEGFRCPYHLSEDSAPCLRTATWELALEAHAETVEWARNKQLN
jgi:hypothetical protein